MYKQSSFCQNPKGKRSPLETNIHSFDYPDWSGSILYESQKSETYKRFIAECRKRDAVATDNQHRCV